MKYTEVELKYRLTDRAPVKARLAELGGKPGVTTRQVDTYFNAPHRDFLASPVVFEWLRLRESKHGDSINYKRWLPEDDDIKTHCDEYETQVSDVTALRLALSALGFTKLVTVEKVRQEWRLPGDVVVAFDTVAHAGRFVEFEFKGSAENAEDAIEKLQEFVVALGVALGERIHRGYPHMLLGRER